MAALEESEWLVSARFEFHQLRVKIPFLHKTDAGWEVYFLYGGHLPKEDEAFQLYAKRLGAGKPWPCGEFPLL